MRTYILEQAQNITQEEVAELVLLGERIKIQSSHSKYKEGELFSSLFQTPLFKKVSNNSYSPVLNTEVKIGTVTQTCITYMLSVDEVFFVDRDKMILMSSTSSLTFTYDNSSEVMIRVFL